MGTITATKKTDRLFGSPMFVMLNKFVYLIE